MYNWSTKLNKRCKTMCQKNRENYMTDTECLSRYVQKKDCKHKKIFHLSFSLGGKFSFLFVDATFVWLAFLS